MPDQHEVEVPEEAMDKFVLELFGFHEERLIGKAGEEGQRREVQRMLRHVAPVLCAPLEAENEELAEQRNRLHKALAEGHGVEDGGIWEDRALAAEAKLGEAEELRRQAIADGQRAADQAAQEERERVKEAVVELMLDVHKDGLRERGGHIGPNNEKEMRAEYRRRLTTLDKEND